MYMHAHLVACSAIYTRKYVYSDVDAGSQGALQRNNATNLLSEYQISVIVLRKLFGMFSNVPNLVQ